MSMMDRAIEYSRKGLSVIPLGPGSKTPLVKWQQYQTTRATEQEITHWWTEVPAANIGIVCGAVSGNLVVLDVDPRNGGTTDGLVIPKTATVASGGGGVHYYFKSPTPTASFKPVKGLDVQGDGTYVVAPGSVHPSGKPYEWQDSLDLTVPLAQMPEWLQSMTVGPVSTKASPGCVRFSGVN